MCVLCVCVCLCAHMCVGMCGEAKGQYLMSFVIAFRLIFILFLFMCLVCKPVHMSSGSYGGQKKASDRYPGARVTGGCEEPSVGAGDKNHSPLEKQQASLTSMPSLQPSTLLSETRYFPEAGAFYVGWLAASEPQGDVPGCLPVLGFRARTTTLGFVADSGSPNPNLHT